MTTQPAELLDESARPFRHVADGPEGVLLLHGWTGSPAHFRLLADELIALGYSVSAPLYPGHGTRVEDMLATGWRDWLRSAAEAADELTRLGKRLHLIGLSMGGVISILLAPTFDAATLATINAPMKIQSKRARVARLARGSKRIVRQQPLPPPVGAGAAYYHQYSDTPIGKLGDLFDLVRAARRTLEQVECPTLIVQSRVDETVQPESAKIIYDALGSDDKRLLWLDDSRHVAIIDQEREAIFGAIFGHLARVGV